MPIKRNVKVEHVFGILKLKCCADCTTAYESVSEPVLFVIKDWLGSLLSKLAGDGAFGQANSLILLSRP